MTAALPSWRRGVAGMRLRLLEAVGEGEGEPGFAAPGEQPPGGDVPPLGLPPVEDEQEGRRVGRDMDVGPVRAGRADLEVAVAEGVHVRGLIAQVDLEGGGEPAGPGAIGSRPWKISSTWWGSIGQGRARAREMSKPWTTSSASRISTARSPPTG